ncbi:MAG TPA: OB-fold domain-containing protein [Streptosporangiaceae bacterium]|jgi:hypothetical protein
MTQPSEETFSAEHTMEFPGGYTRSLGPVIGRYLTGLRDGRFVGVRTDDGRVIVPPTEYDPETSAALGAADTDFVEVGPAGRVETWAWVANPRAKHPLDRPFAWALIRLDGASTALLHAVDTGDPARMRTGLRVRPEWRADRVGSVLDVAYFTPAEEDA